VTNGEDVIEDLPTPVRAALVKAEQPEAAQHNLLLAASLNSSEKKIYELLNSDEAVHIDDIVERSGLNSSEVLATLFDLEMKGIVRQMPGKRFNKVLLYRPAARVLPRSLRERLGTKDSMAYCGDLVGVEVLRASSSDALRMTLLLFWRHQRRFGNRGPKDSGSRTRSIIPGSY
jgi:DNA-binding MarR family transcriptional regulator